MPIHRLLVTLLALLLSLPVSAADATETRIERVLRGLFDWYCEHPDELPPGEMPDRVIDYLAGMTDRFAIRDWTERIVPQGLAL